MNNAIRIEIHACDHCNLACMGCNHASPFLKKAEHPVEDYFPWIDRLLNDVEAHIDILAITGGEPFLHKGINEFASKLKTRYPQIWVEIFSNLFWLKSEESFDKYAGVLGSVDHLSYSLYQPIVDKAGGEDNLHNLVRLAQQRFPNLTVRCTVGGVNKVFAQSVYTEEYRERTEEEFCYIKDCTQLRPDGTMLRCPLGHGIGNQPGMHGFAASRDIHYDLKTDLSNRDYEKWRTKWPFDACHHCGCGRGRDVWTPWVSDPTVRGMGEEEYKNRLDQLINEGT